MRQPDLGLNVRMVNTNHAKASLKPAGRDPCYVRRGSKGGEVGLAGRLLVGFQLGGGCRTFFSLSIPLIRPPSDTVTCSQGCSSPPWNPEALPPPPSGSNSEDTPTPPLGSGRGGTTGAPGPAGAGSARPTLATAIRRHSVWLRSWRPSVRSATQRCR